MRRLRFLALGGAVILTAGLGISLVLAAAGVFSLTSVWDFLGTMTGPILVILAGGALILVAIYLLLAFKDERLNRALFYHEGEWGRIELAPNAIKELIADVLQKDIGLERFRISLRHYVDGIGIGVQTTLTPDQKVTEVGERIQRELARHVAERTGVEVSDVSVLVRSIRANEPAAKETQGDETYS